MKALTIMHARWAWPLTDIDDASPVRARGAQGFWEWAG